MYLIRLCSKTFSRMPYACASGMLRSQPDKLRQRSRDYMYSGRTYSIALRAGVVLLLSATAVLRGVEAQAGAQGPAARLSTRAALITEPSPPSATPIPSHSRMRAAVLCWASPDRARPPAPRWRRRRMRERPPPTISACDAYGQLATPIQCGKSAHPPGHGHSQCFDRSRSAGAAVGRQRNQRPSVGVLPAQGWELSDPEREQQPLSRGQWLRHDILRRH